MIELPYVQRESCNSCSQIEGEHFHYDRELWKAWMALPVNEYRPSFLAYRRQFRNRNASLPRALLAG
jgi:hypothetical protein